MKMKKSKSRIAFEIANYTFLSIIVVLVMYPILNQIALSFSSANGILQGDVGIIPRDFTLATYKTMMADNLFWNNYKNTIIYTTVGTTISITLTTICAYALSKPGIVGRNFITKLIIFTIFFAGGLIPNYVLIKELGWIDSIWALTIPGAIVPYHILVMRTYFQGLPTELEEASRIDGLGQFGHFIKIALPLSKPILATILLFIVVIYWNDWFSALIYINRSEAQPVTLYLRNALMGATTAAQSGDITSSTKTIPASVQAASMILVTTPIICVYPFVQKYFVKGVMIGAVKG